MKGVASSVDFEPLSLSSHARKRRFVAQIAAKNRQKGSAEHRQHARRSFSLGALLVLISSKLYLISRHLTLSKNHKNAMSTHVASAGVASNANAAPPVAAWVPTTQRRVPAPLNAVPM